MRNLLSRVAAVSVLGLFTTGCMVYVQPRPVAIVEPPPPPVVETAVVVGPGVEVIDVEPDPVDRVYVYDVGYPPGVYVYGGFYWYGGYRYQHDEFVRRVVTVNIRENRFVNVEENRRAGVRIEEQHRHDFAVNHGRPNLGAHAPQRDARNAQPAETRTRPQNGQADRPAAAHAPSLHPDRKPGDQASVRDRD